MRLFGIVGGLGPLASAEFVKTVYDLNPFEKEQHAPRCVLWSDPTFPDRTEAILNDEGAPLVTQLTHALSSLRRIGCERTMITCVTMHHFLPQVPEELRARNLSLLDAVVREQEGDPRPRLLLCTTGTRRVRTFQRHPGWERIADSVRLPGDQDQAEVHRVIYEQLKLGRGEPEVAELIAGLQRKYGAESFIAGCTEFHLLVRHLRLADPERAALIVDPLLSLARDLGSHVGD